MMPPPYFLMLIATVVLPPIVMVSCLVMNEVRWNRWRRENLEGSGS